jgi:drug/metabolite transporter (DMT)-like permease
MLSGPVILAALLWALGGTAAKALFNQDLSPYFLVKMRLLLSFLVLLVVLFCYDKRLLVIEKKDILYFAVLGTFGMAFCQVTYLCAIMLTSVATGIFLEYLAPIFIAAYEVVWEKARLGAMRGAAVVISALGGLLIMIGSGGTGNINILGLFVGLLSAVAFSINTVYGRRAVRKYQPVTGVMYSFGFGALACWLFLPDVIPFAEISARLWGMIFYIAIFSTVAPFLLYFVGVRFLAPTNAGTTACLEPVIAALAAYLALGETMGMIQIIGGAFIIAAVLLLQKDAGREELAGQVFHKEG